MTKIFLGQALLHKLIFQCLQAKSRASHLSGEDNVFLIGEIAKKGAARSVDCLGNFVNGGLLVALLVKKLNGCIKQSPSYQFPLLFTQCFLESRCCRCHIVTVISCSTVVENLKIATPRLDGAMGDWYQCVTE